MIFLKIARLNRFLTLTLTKTYVNLQYRGGPSTTRSGRILEEKYKYEVREWMKELKKSIVDWNVCGCFYIIWVWVWVWVFWVFLCIGFLFYMLCRGVAYIINLSFRWAKKQLFLTHESCWYRGEEEFLAPGNRKSAIFERLIKQEF